MNINTLLGAIGGGATVAGNALAVERERKRRAEEEMQQRMIPILLEQQRREGTRNTLKSIANANKVDVSGLNLDDPESALRFLTSTINDERISRRAEERDTRTAERMQTAAEARDRMLAERQRAGRLRDYQAGVLTKLIDPEAMPFSEETDWGDVVRGLHQNRSQAEQVRQFNTSQGSIMSRFAQTFKQGQTTRERAENRRIVDELVSAGVPNEKDTVDSLYNRTRFLARQEGYEPEDISDVMIRAAADRAIKKRDREKLAAASAAY